MKTNLIYFLPSELMSNLIKTTHLCKFVTYGDQLGGCSDDEFEKIDFLLCTCTMWKVVSSERASQADFNGL